MSEDASVALVRALIENLQGSQLRDDWSSFALVLAFEDGDLADTYGYAYSPGGEVSAASVRSSWVREAVFDYLRGYFGPEDDLPKKTLVQFDRTSGRYGVTFEDEDASRWDVTPANYKDVREQLRPSFD
ncbi:hypothetical protein [Microbacterium sp. JZ31]|uniref:hypothetical protein n=1 Tax=Microbacterium sp. JZ31 TaxID=1906274 RepID=UPI00193161DC|nr:hypothetical protein [Microbacterium sp. JZ31]